MMALLRRAGLALLDAFGFDRPAWTRPVLHLTDTKPHELASVALPWTTSSWRAGVGGGVSHGEGRELHQSWHVGVGGAFRYDGKHLEVLDAPVNDHECLPVRLWLEARAGVVRVMVAGKGAPVFVRFDGLQKTRGAAS